AERDDRGDQLLEDLELLAVHLPEVPEEQEAADRGRAPEPLIEVGGDLADGPRGSLAGERRHLLGSRLRRRGLSVLRVAGEPDLLRLLLGGRGTGQRRPRGLGGRRRGRR